jgi:hypothetical protein
MKRMSLIAIVIGFLFNLLSLLYAQDRQVPFDTKGKILEILKESPFAQVWQKEIPQFNRLLAFDADSVVVIEVYQQRDGATVRSRESFSRPFFALKQNTLDSLENFMSRQGVPLAGEELEDLRTTFTYDQTGFSTIHGFTIATLLESSSAFFIVAGGSYFLASSLSDRLALTRANVEAARYGHLSGLLQGYALGLTFFGKASDINSVETSIKAVLAISSLGGIANAVASYNMMGKPDVNPTTQYLRLVAERHSLLWGAGISLMVGGETIENRALMGAAITTSLSSLFWSEPLFGLANRRMSWGDALLVDEFMTPWYLTITAAATTLKLSGASGVGSVFTVGGIGGYLLGMQVNEGGNRDISTVRRTRLLTYGGSLLGLGVILATKANSEASWWIVAGTTWLGYIAGMRSGGSNQASSWDLQIMPEGVLLGSLSGPSPIPRPAPVAQFTLRF